ncbi:14530_t:CDS:1, partial [Cetraspora pellucida]
TISDIDKFPTSNIEIGKTKEIVQNSRNSIESQNRKDIQKIEIQQIPRFKEAYDLPICSAHNPGFYVTNI